MSGQRIEAITKRGFDNPVAYRFICPGCKDYHVIWVNPEAAHGVVWQFNGDLERPTFSPSLKLTYKGDKYRPPLVCHSFIRDGKIQFLGDCTHALAGQTVDLAEIGPTA